MSKANRIIVITGFFLMVLVVFNPSERSYLNTIGEEYGSIHHGMSFSPAQLLEIGSARRNNLILLSKYRYEFGNIEVNYIGFCGLIFKVASARKEPLENPGSSDQIMT